MNEPNQKPSIEEQYAVALSCGAQSSVVMAAGLQRDRAGVLLLRLRAEYDAVRSQFERAGHIAPSAGRGVWEIRQEISRLEAQIGHSNSSAQSLLDKADALRRDVAAISARTPAEVKTARAIILVALTSLQPARQELGVLAVRMAASPKRGLGPDVALQLAGRVLDVWLDETCHKCDGTGRLGNRYAGERERECTACKGSGHRRDILGDSLKQTLFARDLFAELQRQVAAAAAGIKAAIHADSGPSKPMHPELVRRLAELRGVDAAAD